MAVTFTGHHRNRWRADPGSIPSWQQLSAMIANAIEGRELGDVTEGREGYWSPSAT
jgi:hypothetical protein